jgi:hypothetical protein
MKQTSDHLGFSAMEEAKKTIEKLIDAKLKVCYDSTEDDNKDEEYGHWISTVIEPEPFEGATDNNMCINFYEDGTVQFYFDATPYPVAYNMPQEAMDMRIALNHYPVPFEKVTQEDYIEFVNFVKEELSK